MTLDNSRKFFAGAIILVLMTTFIWAARSVFSPLVAGGLLIFFLLGLKESPLIRRLIIGVVLVLLAWIFINSQNILFPFFLAFALAYFFDPLADWLEGLGVPRTVGALAILLLALGLVTLLGFILIPSLAREIQELMGKMPALAKQVVKFIEASLPKVLEFFKIDMEQLEANLLNKAPKGIEQVLSNILKGISGVGSFLGQIFNVVLVPVLTFYLLKDFDRIKRWVLDFLPRKYRSQSYFYLWRTNRILGGYIRGQIIVCSIVGFFTGLFLTLLNIPFAVLLGVMAGVLNIIPFFGLYISLALSVMAAFFTPDVGLSMIKIVAVFAVVQGLEGYVISPKIVGERVGLHPLAVILSVLFFARFLGFLGLIIGVPSAAIIKFATDEWKRRNKWNELVERKKHADH